MIAPEFPLKKENRQSTNIDFLVSENAGQRVVLVELKTDFRASARQVLEHQEKYQKVVERVKADTAAFLRDDLNAIYDGSGTSHKDKYRRLRAMADRLSSEISDAEILYLVPHRVKEKIRDREIPYTKVLAFSEFPPALGADQDYADFRAALQRLN